MADINGIVTLGASETPGAADVLLLNEAGDSLVAQTTSHATTGAYAFAGLAEGTTFRVVVLGDSTYRSRAFGPCTTSVASSTEDIFGYVSLLHFDGSDGATTFIDQSGKTWTAVGNAQIDTAQSKFGGASLLLDGTGDYLQGPNSPDFGLTLSGDFTIECYFKHADPTAAQGENVLLCVGDETGYWQLLVGDNTIRINSRAYPVGGYSDLIAYPTLDTGWHHFAWARASGVDRLFYDGALLSAAGSVINTQTANGILYVGANYNGGGTSFSGHIDDVRVTKGFARYVTGFTPSTAAFPNGQLSALLHFDGADASTTITDAAGKTWTVAGNAQLDTAQSKFGSASLLLDGSGDYVTTPADAAFDLGAGDFAVEAWVRAATWGGGGGVVLDRYASGVVGAWQLFVNPGGVIEWYTAALALSSTSAVPTNAWVHIAVTRVADTLRIFINGVLDTSLAGHTMNYASVSSVLAIGGQVNLRNSTYDFNGHIDEVRITKGDGRYAASFTPPTAPFPNP